MNPSTSNFRLMRWRLLGKELRQLLPLFAAMPLAFVGFLGLIPAMGFFFKIHGSSPWELAFQLPGVVFSVGAVGLLVCQEKEQRSLTWLAGLPIPALEIIRSKLLAGIVGTGLVWLVSVLMSFALQPLIPVSVGVSQWLLCLIINLYIMFAGFAIVWRVESTHMSLFLLLAIAFLPAGIAQSFDYLVFPKPQGGVRSDLATQVVLALSYVTLGSIAVYLLHRWGYRSLTATPTFATNSQRSWVPYRVTSTAPVRKRLMSPAAGLTWQMLRQNRWVLAVIGLMFLATFGLFLFDGPDVKGAAVAALAASWLGVITFGSDVYRNQIRFLGDRGVSRWQVWWTRQLAPLSMISLYVLLAVVGAACIYGVSPTVLSAIGQLSLVGLFFLISVYSVSQWLGQQIQSTIVTAVVSPPVSIGVVGMAVYLLDSLGIHPMLIVVVAITSLIGTWWTMPGWMDRTLGGRSAWRQLSVAVVSLVVAGGAIAWPLFSPPQIDPVIAAEMQAFRQHHEAEILGNKPQDRYRDSNTAWLEAEQKMQETLTGIPSANFLQSVIRDVRRIQQEIDFYDHALEIYGFWRDARYLEQLVELIPYWNIPDSDRHAIFNDAIRAHSKLVRRVRLSNRLQEQEAADLGEIWLLRQILAPQNSPLFEDRLYNELVAYLANDEARQIARRRALVATWDELQQHSISIWRSPAYSRFRFADMYFPSRLRATASLVNRESKQEAIEVIENLWSLSASSSASQEAMLKKLAHHRRVPEVYYGIGPLGEYFRTNDATQAVADSSEEMRYLLVPLGQHWRAGWETQAKQLQPRVVSHSETTEGLSQKGADALEPNRFSNLFTRLVGESQTPLGIGSKCDVNGAVE